MTAASDSRAYRDRKRGGPPRTPAPCGTPAAAKRHRRHGEPLCAPCVAAERAYFRERKPVTGGPFVGDPNWRAPSVYVEKFDP
jgi:hypothetical protein